MEAGPVEAGPVEAGTTAILRGRRRGLRLPASAHASQPWRIHEFAGDYRLEDVWAMPTPGGRDDFGVLMEMLASSDSPLRSSSSRAVRALITARKVLGVVFRWDDSPPADDDAHATVRDRLPPDLAAPGSNGLRVAPFRTLYLLNDEWAAELENRTMRGILHIGWVRDGSGGYRGQLAVLVKPNGLLGAAYMAAISPFRHLIVYPQMLREIERAWRRAVPAGSGGCQVRS
ncbi:MAG: DUF2867 domain-containing protein [Nocardiopsaceae bacterium]|jgi:hypothetical protein|nr:DUF2867 domain-containing protein [Nocardiopsaceae bacterium]